MLAEAHQQETPSSEGMCWAEAKNGDVSGIVACISGFLSSS